MSANTPDAHRKIQLDVVSDPICPWCYIGKHRLRQGLELLDPEIDIDVHWRPFELNPTMPREGMDRDAYCERKFGSIAYARQLYANVAANAKADGLPMEVDRIARTPNTRLAHRLIAYAEDHGRQNDLVDTLFAAYFVEGRDIGDAAVLGELAHDAGLDAAAVDALLADDGADAAIDAQEREAQGLGVQGVPAFLFNGKLLFSGAQDPRTIALAIERALTKGLSVHPPSRPEE